MCMHLSGYRGNSYLLAGWGAIFIFGQEHPGGIPAARRACQPHLSAGGRLGAAYNPARTARTTAAGVGRTSVSGDLLRGHFERSREISAFTNTMETPQLRSGCHRKRRFIHVLKAVLRIIRSLIINALQKAKSAHLLIMVDLVN